MSIKNNLIGFSMLVIASIPGHAIADNYFGLGIGNASYDIKPLYGSFSVEDSTAYKFVFGTRSDNLGFEAEWSYSEHDWKGSGGLATHNVSNFIISGVGYMSLGSSVDLFGKLGINFWSTTVDFVGTTYDGDDGSDLALGFGTEFNLNEKFHLRLEYQMLSGIGDGVDEGDMTLVSASAIIKF